MEEKTMIPMESVPESMENLGEVEAKEYKRLLTQFLRSYKSKGQDVSDARWLEQEFKKELPNLPEGKAAEMAAEIVGSTSEYDAHLSDLNKACKQGTTKEQWLSEKVAEAAKGMSVVDYGNYLYSVNSSLENANAQMLRTVTTKSGEVSRALNLDGFIAEQHHVNQFNIRAALSKSPYVAEVCTPATGETYGKNSFDCVIRDRKSGAIIHQYQVKYGKTAEATAQLIREGNYNNQRLLVPPDQVEKLRELFPGKSIDSVMGGTDRVPITSTELSKEQAKALQDQAQTDGTIQRSGWNSFNTKELALNLGKNAAITGMQAATVTAGFCLAQKAIKGEPIEKEEIVHTAISTGMDAGIKNATAGALEVWAQKSPSSVLQKITPAGWGKVAAVGIENAKILWKVAKGEMTLTQGADAMGRTSTAMVAGLSAAAKGSAIGAAALGWIPVVGPIVGGMVGGMVGYAAGSTVGQAVYKGVKAVGSAVKNAVRSTFSAVRSFAGRIFSCLFG
ncbi:MAG: hypothetical protein J6K89_01260 [Oscillospiraceae bacterium]|nr:hypothetical protein [Oscillospiraceae bacterium]